MGELDECGGVIQNPPHMSEAADKNTEERSQTVGDTGWLTRRRLVFRSGASQFKAAVGFLWESSPDCTLTTVVLVFLQSLLPVASLYVMKLVIDEVEAGFVSPRVRQALPSGKLSCAWLGRLNGKLCVRRRD
jgi:hypothetical protein